MMDDDRFVVSTVSAFIRRWIDPEWRLDKMYIAEQERLAGAIKHRGFAPLSCLGKVYPQESLGFVSHWKPSPNAQNHGVATSFIHPLKAGPEELRPFRKRSLTKLVYNPNDLWYGLYSNAKISVPKREKAE